MEDFGDSEDKQIAQYCDSERILLQRRNTSWRRHGTPRWLVGLRASGSNSFGVSLNLRGGEIAAVKEKK